MCAPATLTARYLDVLRHHLGLEAEAPEELAGSVVFQHEGLTFMLVNHAPNDPEYVELTLMMSFADRYDLATRAAVAGRLTCRYKTFSAAATEDGMLLSFDSVVAPPKVLPSPGILVAVLPRFLDQVATVRDALHTELEFHALTSSLSSHEAADGRRE